MVVHLTGMALDGHKRIVECIRRHAGDKAQVEELDNKLAATNLLASVVPNCLSP